MVLMVETEKKLRSRRPDEVTRQCVCLKKKRDQESGARRQQQPQNRSKGNRGYYGKKKVHTVKDNGDSDKADDDFVQSKLRRLQNLNPY